MLKLLHFEFELVSIKAMLNFCVQISELSFSKTKPCIFFFLFILYVMQKTVYKQVGL